MSWAIRSSPLPRQLEQMISEGYSLDERGRPGHLENRRHDLGLDIAVDANRFSQGPIPIQAYTDV